MLHIYNVGPLFTEGEKKQRQYEGRKISELLRNNFIDFVDCIGVFRGTEF